MSSGSVIDEYDLYDHQRTALRKLSNGKLLWGGVGTGKSRVAAAYYKENEAPRHVYVITPAKKRDSFDWEEEFYKIGIGPVTGPSGPGPGSSRNVLQQGDLGSGPAGRQPVQGSAAQSSSGVVLASGPTAGAVVRQDGAHPHGPDTGGSESGVAGPLGEAGIYPYVVTVDSWNNLAKYVDVVDSFFIFDEQRLVGTGEWSKAFLKIAKRNHWIILSGTPGDTWMDYATIFVANNLYKNITEFRREHCVYVPNVKFPKISRYINVGRLARQRSQLLVEMPYVRHTRRRQVEVNLPYDKETLDRVLKERWHVYEERPLRDVGEMFRVARKVVNSDPSRLDMVVNLWETHPKLIIFYNFDYELESLTSLADYYGLSHKSKNGWSTSSETTLSSSQLRGAVDLSTMMTSTKKSRSSLPSGSHEVVHSVPGHGAKPIFEQPSPRSEFRAPSATKSRGISKSDGLDSPANFAGTMDLATTSRAISMWNGHKHQPIPTTDRWLYLVHYSCGDAWNCTQTDATIKYSQNYSWKITEQAEGRTDRLDTLFKDLWYYGFTSDSWIDKAIARALKAKGTFNEAKYARMFQ